MREEKKKGRLKPGIVIAAILVVVVVIVILKSGDDGPDQASGYTEFTGYAPENSYMAYLEEYSTAALSEKEILIRASEYSASEGTAEIFPEYEGEKDVVLTGEDGYIEWKVEVPKSGFYQMDVKYLAYGGNGLAVERSVYIDGELPYSEAAYLTFARCFKDVAADSPKDLNGNDIRPSQEEVFIWQEKMLKDASGYYAEPLKFYLTAGTHTIRLVSEREPLMLAEIKLGSQEEIPDYATYKAEHEKQGHVATGGDIKIIQAEDMYLKSEKSNYPINDRTSSYTQPQDAYTVLLNSMGGTRWQSVGSAVSWIVTVEETGLYKIAPRYRQAYVTGMSVTRRLLIDGKVPFEEAGNLRFGYDSEWQLTPFGNDDEDYLFYFEAGREYVLTMDVVLGDMANILRRVDASVEELNAIYRSILMVTGASPDKSRDYMFEKIIPQTLEDLTIQAEELAQIREEFQRVNGSGERMAQLTKMEHVVARMANDPDEIAGQFATYKDNVAALASWILEMSKQPLAVDYLAIVPANEKVPKADGGFFEKVFYQVELFIASFTMDYSEMGITAESAGNAETITVWLSTGRDQMNTIRSLINADFTKKTGITVNLELVSGGTLLPSVLAGTGPDVSLSNAMGDPINLALRNSVYDLSTFPDYEEVVARFSEAAMVPYQYKGKTYALPETMSFNMLFYRKDIFEELGLIVPQTWSEWDNVIGELSKKNMAIGLPHDQNLLLTFMYQMGSELYNNEGESVNLDSKEAMLSFERLTEYYTLYKFPTEYDFVNRFRAGEMPLAIADYTVYNQLSLFAPEIQGEWGMELVPGTLKEDGTIDRTIPFGGSSVVILGDTKHAKAAWEFLKWWTSTEVQVAYCNEMESVIDASAKQATANVEALKQLTWTKQDLDSLLREWQYLKGTPEVPGGYYVGRTYTFAFNKVVNDSENPADTLQKYIESINSELTRKRKEFGITE